MKRWIGCALLVACGQPATPGVSQVPVPTASASSSASAAPSVACSPSASPYLPVAAWSGARPDVPAPPTLPDTPMRVGDAYTVYGALHALHSRFGAGELSKSITVVGYIVDTNLPRAPKCALHKTGIADPKGCSTEIPAFTVADAKTGAGEVKFRVMGWASNFPNVYEAYLKYKALTAPPPSLYVDEIWGGSVPYPLPAVGAKVRIKGHYAFTFTKSSAGVEADPDHGVFTLDECVTLEPAPRPASFPQLGP